jgi:hypothetical protein
LIFLLRLALKRHIEVGREGSENKHKNESIPLVFPPILAD